MSKMFMLVLSISFLVTGCSMMPGFGDFKYKAAVKACDMSHDSCVEKNEQACAEKKLVCYKGAEKAK
jgi:hypothetical protein